MPRKPLTPIRSIPSITLICIYNPNNPNNPYTFAYHNMCVYVKVGRLKTEMKELISRTIKTGKITKTQAEQVT